VRRFAAILISFLLLTHALLPALPKYICSGMDRAHLLHPCCSAEAPPAQDVKPAWEQAACCQPEPAVTLGAQRPPDSDKSQVVALLDAAAADGLPATLPPGPRVPLRCELTPTYRELLRPPARLFCTLRVLRI